MNRSKFAFSAVTVASALALSGCGGGGGSNGSGSTGSSTSSTSSGTSSASTTVTGTLPSPQYAANSAQLAAFSLINSQRQECGFPALLDNSILDQAAAAHAGYEGANNLVTDTETSGNSGYTGTSYTDRAVHFGFAQGVSVGGVSAAYYNSSTTLSETEYGQNLVYEWMAGVYHEAVLFAPVTIVGVGELETVEAGHPLAWGTLSLASLQALPGGTPLTFPCQGTTGVPYEGGAENPTPPNTSGPWGTPQVVTGNPTDTIILTSGTITPTSGGTSVTLQLLDSANDPNKLMPAYQAVAYAASALAPNTSYSVSINGTVNAKPFSRNYSFTTGNIAG